MKTKRFVLFVLALTGFSVLSRNAEAYFAPQGYAAVHSQGIVRPFHGGSPTVNVNVNIRPYNNQHYPGFHQQMLAMNQYYMMYYQWLMQYWRWYQQMCNRRYSQFSMGLAIGGFRLGINSVRM